jgi:uncharacterized protein (TIGR02996 family)
MSERDAIYRGICLSPEDDFPRLVYADVLDESGDESDRDQAEFIRLQIENKKLEAHTPEKITIEHRISQLMNKHKAAWTSQLPRWINDAVERTPDCDFRRGFPDCIHITMDSFQEVSDDLIEMCPARYFRIHHIEDSGEALAQCPALSHTRGLELVYSGTTPNLPVLLESQYFPQLKKLSLKYLEPDDDPRFCLQVAAISNQDLFQLSNCPKLDYLRKLDISDGYVDAYGIESLANSPYLKRLEELSLSHHPLGDDGLEALTSSTLAEQITHLNLRYVEYGDRGIRSLFSGRWRKLRYLKLGSRDLRISDAAFHSLTTCDTLFELREFDLSDWPLTLDQIRSLAQCPYLQELKVLNLGNSEMDDAKLIELTSSPYLRNLHFLDLQNNQISFSGIEKLANSTIATSIVDLCLFNNVAIGDRGISAIANSRTMKSLKDFSICSTRLGISGLKAICGSPYLTKLFKLDIQSHRRLGDEGAHELLNSPNLNNLLRLAAYHCGFSKKMKRKLRERFGEVILMEDDS